MMPNNGLIMICHMHNTGRQSAFWDTSSLAGALVLYACCQSTQFRHQSKIGKVGASIATSTSIATSMVLSASLRSGAACLMRC